MDWAFEQRIPPALLEDELAWASFRVHKRAEARAEAHRQNARLESEPETKQFWLAVETEEDEEGEPYLVERHVEVGDPEAEWVVLVWVWRNVKPVDPRRLVGVT